MVGDEPFGRGEHALIGRHEALAGLRVVTEGAQDRIADEVQERLHRPLRDVPDGHIGRAGERQELSEGQSRIQQREPGPHRLRIGRRVAGRAVGVGVMREEQSGAGDRLQQGDARTDRLGEGGEVVGRVEVVDRRGDRGREGRIGRVEGVVRSGSRLHATEGRPCPLGSLRPMSEPANPDPATGTGRDALPAAGRDGKDAALVQAMFDRVAPRYDLANTVLSLGQDGHWRRVTAAAARPEGAEVLDVAAGPGNVAVELVRQGAAQVTALDLSFNMLWEGARKGHVGVTWVNGDALELPFEDASFDAVTISFGLRNVPDPEAALAEFARVTRPGGRVVVCEFADPTWGPFREVYRRYLVGALPKVARVVSSSASAYQYLADSILAWPDRQTLAGWIGAAGFDEVRVRDLSGGIVAVHRGVRR